MQPQAPVTGKSDPMNAQPPAYAQAAPVYAQPAAGAQPVTVVQAPTPMLMVKDPLGGLPPGGTYRTEKHCGIVSLLVGVFVWCAAASEPRLPLSDACDMPLYPIRCSPCIICCPIDTRRIYVAPDGREFPID